jgi:hypothetical protein
MIGGQIVIRDSPMLHIANAPIVNRIPQSRKSTNRQSIVNRQSPFLNGRSAT